MEDNEQIRVFLPRKTYVFLESWHKQMSLNRGEDYIEILQEIKSGSDSILSVSEEESLAKLFSSQIINRQNIVNYCLRFSEIQSEDVIWARIIDYLENHDYSNADRVYDNFDKYILKDDYYNLKKEFKEEFIWSNIKEYLINCDFKGADAECAKNLDVIQENDYLLLRKQYTEEFEASAWSRIKEHFEKFNFFGAEVAYKKNKDFIFKEDYLAMKQIFIEKQLHDAWFDITELWMDGDFQSAENKYRKNMNIISLEQYQAEREQYKAKYKERALASITPFLKMHKFEAADYEYDRFRSLIPQNEYLDLKQEYQKKLTANAWDKVKGYWETEEFDKAEYEYRICSDLIPENEYLNEKTKYRAKLKAPVLSRIIGYLDAADVRKAKNEYKKYQDIISEAELSVWSNIIKYWETMDFVKAEIEYKQYQDIITESEYALELNTYKDKLENKYWPEIRFNLERLDFVAANATFEKYKQVVKKKKYLQEKKKYKFIDVIWKKIMEELTRYEFQAADELIKQNHLLSEFFQHKNYEKVKADFIRKYFSESLVDEGKPFILDEQQAAAVGSVGQNILVKARAGSGKTRVIVAKLLYLLEKQQVAKDAVYVLAFNKIVPLDISERLQRITLRHDPQKYSKLDVAQTFHKLSLRWSKYHGKVLAEQKQRFIKQIIEYLKVTNSDFGARVYAYFREESMQVEKKQFEDQKDYYLYLRNLKYRSLKGDTVKSRGEKWIADFLYEHGIDYFYEYSFYPSSIDVNNIEKNDDYRQRCKAFLGKGTGETKPDFFLVKHKIVWEHWGIYENEIDEKRKKDFALEFGSSWQEYRDKMEWKRGLWKPWRRVLKNGSYAIKAIHDVDKLIETSVCDLNCSREEFENKLIILLNNENIVAIKRNEEELIQEVWERAVDHLAVLMESFINRYQQNCYNSRELFINDIENYRGNERVYKFLKLGIEVLDLYETELAKTCKIANLVEYEQFGIDFNQVILEAVKKIENGDADSDILKIKHILIDEYQDFSELFLRLINAIRKRNPNVNYFCVGDDWQAINRFAGSDVSYFKDFENYFENGLLNVISTNYRSNPEIIKKSNGFMLANGFDGTQAKPSRLDYGFGVMIEYVEDVFVEMRDNKDGYQKDKIFIDQFTKRDGTKENDLRVKAQYLKKCLEIIKENPKQKILILHRNNTFKYTTNLDMFYNKLCNVLIEQQVVKSQYECKNRIKIRTIHAAKGLEAEVVILLEANQGIIPMFHPDTEIFEIFGENIAVNLDDQKRLFYVAITRAKDKLFILTEKETPSDFLRLLENKNVISALRLKGEI